MVIDNQWSHDPDQQSSIAVECRGSRAIEVSYHEFFFYGANEYTRRVYEYPEMDQKFRRLRPGKLIIPSKSLYYVQCIRK